MTDRYNDYGKLTSSPIEDQQDSNATHVDPFADYPVGDDVSRCQVDAEPPHSPAATQSAATSSAVAPMAGVPLMQGDTDTIEALLDELDQLIGLQRVKTEVRRLLQYVRVQEMRQSRGIAKSRTVLHSVFYGSPGTGKTTVARLYGRMLKALGLLSSGHLVETDRSGLVASYIGQTANKTDSKIQEAIGGVLFIDEAYGLSRGEHAQWDYGSEAIEILIKRMEDHRDNLVVIVAGYPEPMDKFLKSNEGLRSRFSTYIHFDDFAPEEMLEIFQLFCRQENYELGDESSELVLAAIEYRYALRDKTFGNARFVRNLFETVIRNHALRIGLSKKNPTEADLRLILPEDVPLIVDEGL